MSTMFWIWMAAAAVFLILELVSPTFVFACFVAGSVGAGIYAYISPESYYWQLGIFIGITLVLLPLTRRLAHRITGPSAQKSNVDALIDQVAIVVKPIDPDLGGQVRLRGEIWLAHADEPIERDRKVRVVSVSGARLEVTRIEAERIDS